MRKIIFSIIITLSLFLSFTFTSCNEGIEEVDLYDSFTTLSKEINYIYDNNFSITEKNSSQILKDLLVFEEDLISYKEMNNSLFHVRLLEDNDTLVKILSCVNDLKIFLNQTIQNDNNNYASNTKYMLTLFNRISTLMYDVEHNKYLAANSIISDYIKYFMIFIAFFSIFCLVLMIILYYELKEKDFKIKETTKLLNYTIKGQEEEKQRIARELHDTVAQDMRYIIQLTRKLKTESQLQALLNSEERTLKEVRSLCGSFIPQDLENKDLISSLQEVIDRIESQTNMEVKITVLNDIDFRNMNDERFVNFYRVIQEILNNAAKHSEATEISILIKKEFIDDIDYIHLIITDDGKGIDNNIIESIKEQKIITTKHHFGLKNIIQRVQLLNGSVTFTSDNEFGTEISVLYPEV